MPALLPDACHVAVSSVEAGPVVPARPAFARYDLSYLDPDLVTRVDGIVGAFMLVRAEAIVGAGLLDETFFMYGEDLDWAKRITDAGWEVWYNPQVTVLHIKEAASRHSYRARGQVLPSNDPLLREALQGHHAVLS